MNWKIATAYRCAAWIIPGIITYWITLGFSLLYYPFFMLGPFMDFDLSFRSSTANLLGTIFLVVPAVCVAILDISLSLSKRYDRTPMLRLFFLAYVPASVTWHYLGYLVAAANC